jgi:hypothetical protein
MVIFDFYKEIKIIQINRFGYINYKRKAIEFRVNIEYKK